MTAIGQPKRPGLRRRALSAATRDAALAATRAATRAAARAGVPALLLAGCEPAVMSPAGPVGAGEKTILIDSLAIMLAIVIPTIAATFAFAYWYRASNTRAQYRPEFVYSGRIEMVVWSIPLMVIMLLGGVAWIGSHELDPAEQLPGSQKPLEIQGVSLDWKWLFIYPEQGVASVNQLVIPAGRPVHFSLTSGSVMNAFFVPQLGSMIYTMNGMTSRLNLQADHPGTYLGRSSHYSGDGFSDMKFSVRAVPADEFAGWLQATHGAGPKLDEAAYASLARQSTNVPASTYSAVTPNLYGMIASQKIPPAAGPAPSEGFSSKPQAETH
jgi:cytochrome o ubiquinol oxidase subunit 2